MRRLLILVAGLITLLPTPAAAWWDYGHRTIARIAMMEVSPRTRAGIARLLVHARALDTPSCPLRTIEDASVWPDCIRAMGDRFSYTAPWHYQNVNICRGFDQQAACRDGNCVSAQVERNLRLLKTRDLPARERLAAMAFLVHFVGDLHQPMHSGDRDDLGGNRFRAFYGPIRSNLHTIWDGLLAERAISTPPAEARGLIEEFAGARASLSGGTVLDWARGAWDVSKQYAYGTLLADPCDPAPAQPPSLTGEQIAALVPVVRRQVASGGFRLARLLDEAFAPDASPETGTGARPRRD